MWTFFQTTVSGLECPAAAVQGLYSRSSMARLQKTTAKPLMENRRIRLKPVYSFQTLGVSSKPEKRRNGHCPPFPKPAHLWLLLPPPPPLIQNLSDCFLFLMARQTAFTCILDCKYLFVLNVHTLLLGIGAKMDGSLRDTQFSPACTVLIFFLLLWLCRDCMFCVHKCHSYCPRGQQMSILFFGLDNRQSWW